MDKEQEIKNNLNARIAVLYPKLKNLSKKFIKDGYYRGSGSKDDLVDEIIQTSILDILTKCNKDPISFDNKIKSIDNYILTYIKNMSKWKNTKILYNIRKKRKNEVSFSDLDNFIDEDTGEDYNTKEDIITENNYMVLSKGLEDESNPYNLTNIEKSIIEQILYNKRTYKEISKDLGIDIQKVRVSKTKAIKKIKNTLY